MDSKFHRRQLASYVLDQSTTETPSPRTMFAAGPPPSGHSISSRSGPTALKPMMMASAPLYSYSSSAGAKDQRQQQRMRSVSIDESYPKTMTCSVSTLSPHPGSPIASIFSPRTPIFNTDITNTSPIRNGMATNDYDLHILSAHSRQTSLDSQLSMFVAEAAAANNKSPGLSSALSSRRALSLSLPLRLRPTEPSLLEQDEDCEGSVLRRRSDASRRRQSSSSSGSSRVTSAKLRHFNGRSISLMAPPLGRRKAQQTASDSDVEIYSGSKYSDTDEDEPLSSDIGSVILKQQYGVDADKTSLPLKVREAVQRCLADISTAVEEDHPRWALPSYSSKRFTTSAIGSGSSSRSSGQTPDPWCTSGRKKNSQQAGHDDDASSRGDVPGEDADGGGGGGGDRSTSRNDGRRKKKKGRDDMQTFPCPFRRRNPVLFNIRDHEHCARKAFSDVSELKRHIRTYHRRQTSPYQCRRCKQGFMSEFDLDEHSMVPVEQMCTPSSGTPSQGVEDGITEEMDRVLADRKAKRKVQSWKEIWQLIFPQDTAVLDPEFQPVVEMVEVEQEFEESQAELKADLHENLRMFLPDVTSEVCFFLAGQVQLVFEQHRAKVTRKCRADAIDSKTDHHLAETTANKANRLTVRYSNSSGKSQITLPPTPSTPIKQRQIAPKHSSSLSKSSFPDQNFLQASVQLRSSMVVESPRLPFRDWVHGIKFGNETNPRDSGLALQCEICCQELCQCCADEGAFSNFMSEDAGFQNGTHGPMLQYTGLQGTGGEYGGVQDDGNEIDWLAQ